LSVIFVGSSVFTMSVIGSERRSGRLMNARFALCRDPQVLMQPCGSEDHVSISAALDVQRMLMVCSTASTIGPEIGSVLAMLV
jgi:hypothetical protein